MTSFQKRKIRITRYIIYTFGYAVHFIDILCIGQQDDLEEVFEILGYLTYYPPEISKSAWTVWPLIMHCLKVKQKPKIASKRAMKLKH